MNRVIVVTDSNSGITQSEAKELGVVVMPMPFYINGQMFYEDIDLTQEQFYQKLKEGGEIKTSMPLVGDVTDKWDELLKEYDEIVYIPMSSGLSSSCETAYMLSQDYDGKVQVVNNQRISVTMQQSVMDAKHLAATGKSAAQIKEILEKEALESSIYLVVDTLKYLKKGGRITPAAALLGSALNLKPILQIQGDKLDAYKKVRGMKAAKKNMLDAMKKDVEGRFADYVAKGQEAVCQVVCHGQIHVEVVAAVFCGCAWNFSLEITDKFKHFNHQRYDIFGLIISCEKQIVAGTAAHRSPVDDLWSKFCMVTEKSGCEMFHGMQFSSIHDWFFIRGGHTDIKSGDYFLSEIILTGNINARLQFDMVNRKTCDFFH